MGELLIKDDPVLIKGIP
jgi:alpha-tubulin suppressor-like RCC1 family protein